VQTFLIATATVALAEVGDKTQLLSLILAARYRKPWPICIGILLATIVNHAMAGAVGELLARWLTPEILHWVVVASLLAMAVWILIPDRMEEDDTEAQPRHGVMVATIIAFFLAEMGDKTQIATVVLAAQYHPLWQVVAGTTSGMLLANVPVVWLGSRFAGRLPLRATRVAAALLFVGLAIWTLAAGHRLA
jgi:Ca2+/H+ antiporter, TMEM165/GDT1 family